MHFQLLLVVMFAWLAGGAVQAAPLDGANLYSKNCAVCHGQTGNGGMGVPLALTSFQATIDDDYLRRTIRHGRPGRVMPAFNTLSDAEVDAIVKYVRNWNKGPTRTCAMGRVSGDPKRGKQLFEQPCAACHGAGVAGAPKFGDKAAWSTRVAQGKPALYNSALKGKGAMPPKGGNAALSDDAVKAAVDYMVAAAK